MITLREETFVLSCKMRNLQRSWTGRSGFPLLETWLKPSTTCTMNATRQSSIVMYHVTSNNILLDADFKSYVSDFGIARMLKPDSSNWSELAGTYGYIAPGMWSQLLSCYHLQISNILQFGFMFDYWLVLYFDFWCRAFLHISGDSEMRCLQLWCRCAGDCDGDVPLGDTIPCFQFQGTASGACNGGYVGQAPIISNNCRREKLLFLWKWHLLACKLLLSLGQRWRMSIRNWLCTDHILRLPHLLMPIDKKK